MEEMGWKIPQDGFGFLCNIIVPVRVYVDMVMEEKGNPQVRHKAHLRVNGKGR